MSLTITSGNINKDSLNDRKGFPGGSVAKNPSVNGDAEMRVSFLCWKDSLEKEMETHCSIPAWEVPWTEEPRGLMFMGLQRVGPDLVTEHMQIQM